MTDGGFAAQLAEHRSSMWALAYRLAGPDAEDVLQEAMLQAWRTRESYDPARGSLRIWLLVLVADRCRKHLRHRLRRPVPVPLPDQIAARPLDHAGDLDLDRAVKRLAPRQRLAVELHYVLGLDVSETAHVMRCGPGTVKSTLSDARARLRAALEVTDV